MMVPERLTVDRIASPALNRKAVERICPGVSIGKLFAIILALSVLFGPSVAYADMPVGMGHEMQMMEMRHCDAPPSKTADHDKNAGKNCCISMCMAVAVAPDVPSTKVEFKHASTYFAVPTSWHGFLGEIATPPPRSA